MQRGGARDARAAPQDGGLAQAEAGSTWSDLVLPEAQRALLESASASLEAGARLRLLFTGGPTGTAKACQILGAALDGPVIWLDVGGDVAVQRKALDKALRAAHGKSIVALDHADSMLRGRPDSHHGDDALSAEAALERVRDHEGAVVFISTPKRGIADELLARFDGGVDFPFPEREERKETWRGALPADARLSEEELEQLADAFQLNAGAIRTCSTAAVLGAEGEGAPVSLVHVARVLARAYRGRPAGAATLAALAELRHACGLEEDAEPPPLEARPVEAPPVEPQPVEAPPVEPPRRGRLRRALHISRRRRATFRRRRRAATPAGRGAMTPPDRRTTTPRRRPRAIHVRRWAPALALVATIVAAGLGFLVGRASTGHASPAKHVSVGLGSISLPPSWHRQAPPASPRVFPGAEVALAPARPAGRVLLVGSGATTAPTFLPQGLLASLPGVPTPQVVRIGSLQFYRYQILSVPGQARQESVYVLPTTAGTIVGDCVAPGVINGFDGSCQRVLATLRLTSGSALSLTPSPTYTSELDHVLIPLNLTRATQDRRLFTAQSPDAVAAAARILAGAHASAAAQLAGVDAGIASAANTALATALTQTAAAYRALARAAISGDQPAYQKAKAALTRATIAMTTAYAELGSLGYRVG